MTPEGSSQLLQWFVNYTGEGGGILGCVIYEMFNLHDSFGRVMVTNLRVRSPLFHLLEGILTWCKARNVTLPGAEPFNTLESLSKRLTDVGFTAARALTLKEIRRAYVEESELNR